MSTTEAVIDKEKEDDSESSTQKKNTENKKFNIIQILVLHIIVIVAVLWVMFGMILGVKYAPNDDMNPSIHSGDVLVYYRMARDYKAQDVVILKKNDTEYVGRIVAKTGDIVEVTDTEELIINGNVVHENNIYSSTPLYEGYQNYPIHLNNDEFFVLVDSRKTGEDSRYYGVVKKSDLKGKVIMVIRRNSI